MARAGAELLAVTVVRGSVPGGGCTANPSPVVPGKNAPGLPDLVVLLCDDDGLASEGIA
jgi:hypothetical protein